MCASTGVKKMKLAVQNEDSQLNQYAENNCLLGLDESFLQTVDFNILESINIESNEFSDSENCASNLITNSKCRSVSESIRLSLLCNSIKDVDVSLSVQTPEKFTLHNEEDSFFGLPHYIKQLFHNFKSIEELYEWQQEVLGLSSLQSRQNLLLILPTSGGKTLIAEILILKELLCHKKDVIFILPYVSLVHEKINSLSPFALELGFLIEEYAGSKGKFPPLKRRKKHSVFISTIEKTEILINSLIEETRMNEIGLIVVDEFHLIGESVRGAIIESILIKVMHCYPNSQVIALSATIGNPNEMADFINGVVYTNNFRPVNLFEFVKIDDDIFRLNNNNSTESILEHVKTFKNKALYNYLDIDPDFICYLVKEVIPKKSCLVFCPTKKNCENISELICKTLSDKILNFKKEEKIKLLKNLLSEGQGHLCRILKKTIPYGIVYHHSGLTTSERKILEEAFLNNIICCICCTSTLAAGVNLPAARVILRSPYVGSSFITFNQYKQMVGRAGRAGMEEKGESFLLTRSSDYLNVQTLVSSTVGNCNSQLMGEGLMKLILSSLSLQIAKNKSEIGSVLKKSLLSRQLSKDGSLIDNKIDEILNDLESAEIIFVQEDSIKLTEIGKAAVKGNFTITIAKHLYKDLLNAKSNLVLTTHLHLLYLVAPYEIDFNPSHETLTHILLSLNKESLKVAKAVGISEAIISKIAVGRSTGIPEVVIRRFCAALVLNEMLTGRTIWEISKLFSLDRGFIHTFLLSAASFCAAVLRFCEVFSEQMWCYLKLLEEYPQKITFCCSQELIPLMELPAVRLGRARQLFNAGFKNINIIAKTNPKDLTKSIDLLPLKQAKQIVSAAKMILISKAELLQDEAQDLMECLS